MPGRERLTHYVGEELKRRAIDVLLKVHDGKSISGEEMDICIAYTVRSRPELARRVPTMVKTVVEWSREGPPQPIAVYLATLVQHWLNEPPPPPPHLWWAQNAPHRSKRLGLLPA